MMMHFNIPENTGVQKVLFGKKAHNRRFTRTVKKGEDMEPDWL